MMEELQDPYKKSGFQKIGTAVKQSLAVVRAGMTGNRDVVVTKWPRLNRNLLGGLQKGKMYVVAGRPGVGKSAFSNQLIFDILDENKNSPMVVLYWTFEMPGYQQIMRSASKDLKQGLGELFSLDKPLSQVDFNKYAANANRYNNYDIYFNNHPRSMEFIIKANEDIFNTYPDKTVINVYDHSRLISGKADTELQRLNIVSKGCMYLQSKMGVINILISQLNRNIEQEHRAKNQYQPLLTDLFGGDSIGQDAHVVLILNRPHALYGITTSYCDEDPVGLLACHVEKNRDGMLGMIPYQADMSTFTINEREKE